MDKVIHDANSEISTLQNRISGIIFLPQSSMNCGLCATVEMQINQEQLQKKNYELVEIYRDKCKKHAQVTNLYNLLKNQAMRSQIQTAASDSVIQVLESLGGRANSGSGADDLFRPSTSLAPSPRRSPARYPTANSGIEQLHRHQRSGSGSITKNRLDSAAMPPPSATLLPATPQHRTRLPGPPSSTQRPDCQERQQHGYTPNTQIFPAPQRFAPAGVDSRFSSINSGNYGLSSGIKIGRPSDASTEVIIHHGATRLKNDTISGGTISHVGQLYFDQSVLKTVEDTAPYTANRQRWTQNDRDGLFRLGFRGGDNPIIESQMVGRSIKDGLWGTIDVGVNPLAVQNPRNVSLFPADSEVRTSGSMRGTHPTSSAAPPRPSSGCGPGKTLRGGGLIGGAHLQN
ncbi:predicted protein [Histoplasma mississippiense (nom. inval.)]|uniref:predicted protein n=1 Tax=Ajellomyces capsulatus (strain NAm1 / WU24) TaxID=2059318 RepID=UPI000157B53C|nr:predicted protein [Histoplasma mississippiense (nom. inval.)]EDN02828.1 predicted protein [Histoplasma mississippiense (nom. inval.)]